MNNTVVVRRCMEYDLQEVYRLISDIYQTCEGPELKGKKVLLKPNMLSDNLPEKCVTTHPVVFEAMIMFLKEKGATVFAGDSPAVHFRGFRPVKSGLSRVCEKTGVPWIDFTTKPSNLKLRNGKIRIASVINEVDLIVSMPKLKNHELVYFTGALKNTLGLVPGFSKATQHALYQNRESFSRFIVDLNEAFTPHFFLMDGIIGMEGHGPAQGTPFRTEVLLGSVNPLALDIIASTIAGYDPKDIPISRIALARGIWLKSADEISYNGPALNSLIRKDFNRIPVIGNTNVSLKFLKDKIRFLRKFDRRPVFIHENCTGCRECIKICPRNALTMDNVIKNYVVLTDSKCIRCFCCSEVCKFSAVKIKVRVFGT